MSDPAHGALNRSNWLATRVSYWNSWSRTCSARFDHRNLKLIRLYQIPGQPEKIICTRFFDFGKPTNTKPPNPEWMFLMKFSSMFSSSINLVCVHSRFPFLLLTFQDCTIWSNHWSHRFARRLLSRPEAWRSARRSGEHSARQVRDSARGQNRSKNRWNR